MKNLKNFVNEVRNKASYGQKSTLICSEDELDRLSDIIRAGAKAMKYDLEADKNKYDLVVAFLDIIETMGGQEDDETKIVLFKKEENKD
jgi:hypothetical protein